MKKIGASAEEKKNQHLASFSAFSCQGDRFLVKQKLSFGGSNRAHQANGAEKGCFQNVPDNVSMNASHYMKDFAIFVPVHVVASTFRMKLFIGRPNAPKTQLHRSQANEKLLRQQLADSIPNALGSIWNQLTFWVAGSEGLLMKCNSRKSNHQSARTPGDQKLQEALNLKQACMVAEE